MSEKNMGGSFEAPKSRREITEDVRTRLKKIAENIVNDVLRSEELTKNPIDESKRNEILVAAEQGIEKLYSEGVDFFEPTEIPYVKWNAEEKRWELKWKSEEASHEWGSRHRFLTMPKIH